MTAEAYLRTLADQEQKSVVAESQMQPPVETVQMIVAEGEPAAEPTGEITAAVELQPQQMMMNIDDQQQIPVATSAHTRDAARLRSIMRGNEASAALRTDTSTELPQKQENGTQVHAMIAPILDTVDGTAEAKSSDPTAVIPLPSEPLHSFKSAPMPAIEKPILPLEIDIIRPIMHVADLDAMADLEPVAELAGDAPVAGPVPDGAATGEMQEAAITATPSIDEPTEIAVEAMDEEERAHEIVTIVRYPQEECELVVPEADEVYDSSRTELHVAEPVRNVEADMNAITHRGIAAARVSIVHEAASPNESEPDAAVTGERTVASVSDGRRDDDRTGPAEPAASRVSPSLPSRRPVKEEAARKATRLRPPEPRANDIRLPRSVQISPSNSAPQPAPVGRDRRGPAVETRLRATVAEAVAPRPLMNAGILQTAAQPASGAVDRPAAQPIPRYEEPSQRVEPDYTPRFEAITPMEMSKRELAQQSRTEETIDPFAAEFQKKKKLVIAVSTMTVGVILGLGLYAGGADYVSGLFANKHEGINSSRVAAVTAPMQMDRPSVTEHAIDPTAASESHASSPSKPGASRPADGGTSSENVAAAKKAQPVVAQQKATATGKSATDLKRVAAVSEKNASHDPSNGKKPAVSTKLATVAKATSQERGARSEKAAAKTDQHLAARGADASKKTSAKSVAQRSGKEAFTVQVRATKDANEAKKIAAKLKAKGVRGVSIVTSDNGGSKLYRVRFGSYGTSADAKSAAGRAGVDGAWVVKQH